MGNSIYDNYPAERYVDEFDKESSEQCKRCKGDCKYIGMTGEFACAGFKPMTNADKIRSMTDDELAEWLEKICRCWDCFDCAHLKNCPWNHEHEKARWVKYEYGVNPFKKGG